MRQLYKHQKRFIAKNPEKALLVWETQTGKTIAACEWIKLRPKLKTIVICPKLVVEKWKRDLKEWGAKADVVSMSQISKVNLHEYTALVLDEAHHFSSPLFNNQRSKRTEDIYNFLKVHPDMPRLLLTATPIRSTPWNIHTLAALLGKFWNIHTFRSRFFYFTDLYGRFHWEKNADWRKGIRPLVEEIADIVLLSDCADVPKQYEQLIEIPWTKADDDDLNISMEYMEPSKEWHTRHKAENGRKKFEKIMEIMDGYRKAIVVCNYSKQIDDYVQWIGDDRQVYVLDGRTKDQDATIEAAKKDDDCIFIVQSSMGAGFSASEFSVVIFASMSFRYTDLVQMRGRVKVITNLHENNFYYLLGGRCDRRVYETIMAGKDFDVLQEVNNNL